MTDNDTVGAWPVQDYKTLPRLWQPGKWNAVELKEPLSPYEMLCGLLVPLYAGRAVEEAFYGPRSVTLTTAKEVRAQAPASVDLVAVITFTSHTWKASTNPEDISVL